MHRKLRTILFTLLCTSSLVGCGSSFNGSLTGRGGDGTGPTPAPAQAQITAVSPTSAVAGTGDFTLTVSGRNFLRGTSVLWDDNRSLDTVYVSSTTLTALVPAALIAKPTTVTIIPTPIQTFNFGTTFTVTVPPLVGNLSFTSSKVTVAANDLAWDSSRERFYLSVSGANATGANSVTVLDPSTGALGTSMAIGSEPVKLATSADGTYLYVGLDSAGTVRRYTLPAMQPDIDIPLGAGTYGPFYAIDVQPEPGSSRTVAVSRGVAALSPRETGGIAIYDDRVARPQQVAGFGPGPGPIDALVWNTSGSGLYGLDTEDGTGVYLMTFNPAGLQLQGRAQNSGTGRQLHVDPASGYLYSDNGVVTDPATQTVIGSFPLGAIRGGLLNPVMVPDSRLGIAYFLGQTFEDGGSGMYVIEAYDLKRLTFLGAIPLPGIEGTPSKLIRWGTDGLAFLTGTPYGTADPRGGVYLIRGGFVTSPAL